MKKKAMLIAAAGVLVLAAGCGNQGAGKTETTAAATTAAATTAAETIAAEVKESETAAEVTAPEMKTYKDSKGWQVKYDPSQMELKEEKDGASFVYTGEAKGDNLVKISFTEGKQPQELLYEITESWGD